MSLEKAIKVAEEGLIIDDLRSALANTQKQLAKVKKNRDDFTQAVSDLQTIVKAYRLSKKRQCAQFADLIRELTR